MSRQAGQRTNIHAIIKWEKNNGKLVTLLPLQYRALVKAHTGKRYPMNYK